jgi:hypothetical protein
MQVLSNDVGRPEGFVNFHTMLTFLGFSEASAHVGSLALLVISVPLLFGGRFVATNIAFALLSSPRTESPTFVLIAPAYLFLAREWLDQPRAARWPGLAALAAAMFLITLGFNDLWPKRIFNPVALHFVTKSIGTFVLWLMSGTLILAETVGSWRERLPRAAPLPTASSH